LLVTSAVKHPSVLQPLRRLARDGWAITELTVDAAGRVDIDHAAQSVTPEAALVSVMLANNQPTKLR
jgi:cysteine desulfurase